MIETERLLLRQWKQSDRESFCDLNLDLEVMKFFPNTVSKKNTNLFIDKLIFQIDSKKFGYFAVELKETRDFIGFIGLEETDYETYFTPCFEIGWRIHKKYWRKGFCTEGAIAALSYGFEKLKLEEIVSFTAKINLPSIGVMEKIGMKRDFCGDFLHPKIKQGHELEAHVLYRIKKVQWQGY